MLITGNSAMTAPRERPHRLLWLALLAATATAALLLVHIRKDRLAEAAPRADVPTLPVDRAMMANDTDLAPAQTRARQAALVATVSPVEPTIAERPDYVSEMEWQILNGVAANSTDPDRELGRLVAKLRFTRQLELWQEMAPHDARRSALTLRLLEDIPQQVTNHDLDPEAARTLQQQLVDASITDPVAREMRLMAERQRLRPLITSTETPSP